jgi:hypothetical protein
MVGTVQSKDVHPILYRAEPGIVDCSIPGRIDCFDRIIPGIHILVQRGRVQNVALGRVHGLKPAGQGIVVARPKMGQADVLVKALAAVVVGVLRYRQTTLENRSSSRQHRGAIRRFHIRRKNNGSVLLGRNLYHGAIPRNKLLELLGHQPFTEVGPKRP